MEEDTLEDAAVVLSESDFPLVNDGDNEAWAGSFTPASSELPKVPILPPVFLMRYVEEETLGEYMVDDVCWLVGWL